MTILKSSLTNSPGVRSETEGWRSPALVPMASDGIALAPAAADAVVVPKKSINSGRWMVGGRRRRSTPNYVIVMYLVPKTRALFGFHLIR